MTPIAPGAELVAPLQKRPVRVSIVVHMKPAQIATVTLALVAGTAVGWTDVYATEVQGPLLLFMIVAFACALISSAPAWLIGVAVTVGLPIAHVVSAFRGNTENFRVAMVLVLMPIVMAAYAGRGAAKLIASAAGTLGVESQGPFSAATDWRLRPAAPVALLSFALFACALVGVVPVYASALARQQPFARWVTLVYQTSSFVAWSLTAPLLLRVWQRMHQREAQGVSPKELASHACFLALITVLHAFALPLLSLVLRVPLGPEGMEYAVKWTLAAYLPLDTLTYCLIIGLGHASNSTRRLRVAGAQESAARGELAASRLASLQAQLQPHFLFNALNAATVLAKRGDAARATHVLTQISDLLRYVLRGADVSQSHGRAASNMLPLSEEITFAESYLGIERERFPDRLGWTVSVDENTRCIPVPHLLLQPLVENAVKHGVGGRRGAVSISIRAELRGETMAITVKDEGLQSAMPVASSHTHGIGLSNTRARLASLYGSTAALTFTRDETGTATAEIILPVRA